MPNTVSASKILPPQLVVTKVDELCDGGGIINCSLSDPTPGGTVIFRVYLLPNTTSPIAELTANGQVTGLDAGTYQVVAIETVNGNATTLPAQNVTIENHIEPLDFEISHTDEHCGDGTMTINVTSGYAVDFLLFDGPETTTLPHPLNFFGDLEDGTYIVHAIDACGNIKAHSYTVPHNEAPFSVGSMGFLPELPACDQITLTHPVTIDDMEDDDLLFPLTFIYTVYPPDGSAPITVTYTEVTGNPDNFPAAHTVPFWYDQLYFYDLQVIDKCGQSHGWNHAPIDLSLFAALSPELGDCGQFFFSISPSVFVAPYFINFTEVPAGFNPTDFNPGHPGPFTSLQTYYGTTSNTVPMGNYAGTLTDACGHTVSFEQDIQPNEFPPQFTPYPQPGCLSTTSDLQIQTISYEIDHVVVTGAPPEFTETLPYTIPAVPNQQGPNEIWLFDLPAGTYYFTIYDTCGIAHEEEYTINPSSIFNLPSSSTFADCEEGFGGIRIRGGNSTILTSVVITSAPAAYTETLPQDVSIHIGASGIFSMEHLPPGDYGFHLINGCGNEYDEVYPVIGYETQATIDVTKHCAAFDVYLSDVSNATAPNFWLQKLNETTGQWMHPNTGAIYVEGTTLGTTNAIQLTNGINNINQLFLGHFRIVKTFQAYQNGEIGPGSTKVCIIPLQEFDNTGEVRIIDIIKLTCDGALASVKVIADGVEPFHFKIIEKNGQPFVIDNGSNDTFIDLEPAVYKFSVEHFCGQAVVKIVDIATLPSQIAAVQPTIPLIECDSDDNDGKADFDLSQFDATIIGSQNASDFTLTYHATEADANSGANALPQPYYSATATLYARLKLNSGDCYDVVTVEVIVNPYPVLQMQLRYPICPDSSRTITADSGMDSYSWSTGANTQSITVTQAGTYTLTVTKDYQGITCTGVYQIEVFPLVAPTIHHVEYQDWTDHDNTLIIHTNEPDTGDFLYSIDGGVTFQSSNTFNGLLPGIYQVMVKDLGDCGHDDEEAHLLMYPRFFTPNGDGYNDYWKVKFDELEPGIQTYIFDRYGKLITGFPVGGRWDGTYNDKELPSTDYWFVVIRQDGREMRGHFSMKR
ncbi:T9SS type B sorting domain-containing protein [Flavobacterium sp. MAH-1]|uniref:T9SS type B sorting domain-containing protein n=1 Tax=Flavobacterium agri TaxID=2743471 RepID=A0A7Y8Y042_9FLAO|nr:T9SS type B sorting domain-containing protein [Flavobacterium agri]NUY80033.1 T9SS type B sorting domain-containing protein [Flavobacterium agri]NYA70058.1 T9SS type B sorting domain-containing protein [Flavobacterium agri]